MRIRFLEIAEIELDEAVRFYNHELPGLGNEFLIEITQTLDRIARFPEAWHPCSNERGDVKPVAFLMALFTDIRKARYWLPSPTSIANRIIGRTDYCG
jgi:hypothetical protein